MTIWKNVSDGHLYFAGRRTQPGETINDDGNVMDGIVEAVAAGRLVRWFDVQIHNLPYRQPTRLVYEADYLFRSLQPDKTAVETDLPLYNRKVKLRRDGRIWIQGELRNDRSTVDELRTMVLTVPLEILKDRYGLFTDLRRMRIGAGEAKEKNRLKFWKPKKGEEVKVQFLDDGAQPPFFRTAKVAEYLAKVFPGPYPAEGVTLRPSGGASPADRSYVPVPVGRFRYLD